jgi:hypothetical protein
VNDAPTISAVGEQTISEDGESGEIPFTIGDVETPIDRLTVLSALSSNEELVPLTGLTLGGSGANRTIKVKPAANVFGRATISLRVRDTGDPHPETGEAANATTTTRTFIVTVTAANDAPTMAQLQQPGGAVKNFPADDQPNATADIIIREDAADDANPNGRFVDGDPAKGVIDQTVELLGITAGVGNEREQTVTLTASADRSDLITNVRFDTANNKHRVTHPTTATTLIYKPVRNAHGTAIVTVILTDNGVGAGGVNVLSTTKRFKIQIDPVNDAPTLADLPTPRTIARRDAAVIPISVSDVETAPPLLDVRATSSNQAVVKDSNIQVDGNRGFITITPEDPAPFPEAGLSTDITVTVTDRGALNNGTGPSTVSDAFQLNVRNVLPPTITLAETTRTLNEDAVANNTITLADNVSVLPADLVLTASTDNPVLVPTNNIIIGLELATSGGGTPPTTGTRSLTVVPAANGVGTATITIRATDNEGLQSLATYRVTFNPVEDAPRISFVTSSASDSAWTNLGTDLIPRFTTREDANPVRDEKTASKLIEIDVTDPETPEGLTFSVSSKVGTTGTDDAVVPAGSIQVTGTGSRRTVTIVPAANRFTPDNPTDTADDWNTASRITIVATDAAGLNSSATFDLRVARVNDAPTVNQVSDITVDEDSGEFAVPLSNITPGPFEAGAPLNQTVTGLTVAFRDAGKDTDSATSAVLNNNSTAYAGGETHTLRLQPKPNTGGSTQVAVTLTDNGGTGDPNVNTRTMRFNVTVGEFNDPPVASFNPIVVGQPVVTTRDVSVPQNGSSDVITFYLSDAEQADGTGLIITMNSSNPTLIPNNPANLELGGSGNIRGLIIRPAQGQFGTGNVVINVADRGRANGTDIKTTSLTVRVTVAPSENPTIVLIPTSASVTVGNPTDLIQIVVADAQTPADQLKIGYQDANLVSSDNPTLVPVSSRNIQFGGSGATRVMIIQPVAGQTGTARITVRVKDADATPKFGEAVFTLNVLGQAPTISTPVPSIVNAQLGGTAPPVTVTVNDAETFPGLLDVTAVPSDTNIVSTVFVLGGQSTRTLTAVAGNRGGTATVRVIVKDAESQTATNSFTVVVADNRRPPTITGVGPQQTVANRQTAPIPVTVGDDLTPVGQLVVRGTSGNTTLVPDGNIAITTPAGNAAQRNVVITPAPNQVGTALITLTVTDLDNMSTNTVFTLTVTSSAVPNDFNSDGVPDLVFQDNSGFLAAWYMSGDDVLSASMFSPGNVGDRGWRVVDSADFDLDGDPDLLFQHTDGSLAVWSLTGVTATNATMLNPGNSGATWRAVATGDFNKDTRPDILFQNNNGQMAVWLMNGTTLASVNFISPSNPGPGWAAVGTGQFNDDTDLDILLQHTDGTLGVWYLFLGTSLKLNSFVNPSHPGDADWRVVGTTDQNGDRKTDILFQHRGNGSVAVWYMNYMNSATSLVLGKVINLNPGGTWQVVAP